MVYAKLSFQPVVTKSHMGNLLVFWLLTPSSLLVAWESRGEKPKALGTCSHRETSMRLLALNFRSAFAAIWNDPADGILILCISLFVKCTF